MQYRWIVLYWMPYDNNLARNEGVILHMLNESVTSKEIVVVVQSDRPRTMMMKRTVITHNGTTCDDVSHDDSSDHRNLYKFIEWAKDNYQAQNWAMVFLGHSGNLQQFSPDDSGDKGPTWMNIQKANEVLTTFAPFELLFLQNCCKGTLEVNYNFRSCCKFILSSQTKVGVPNLYYKQTFRKLSQNPHFDGEELAKCIMHNEDATMFNSYCLLKAQYLYDMPQYLDSAIDEILRHKLLLPCDEIGKQVYSDELFMDVELFFSRISSPEDNIKAFCNFYKKCLIFYYYESAKTKHPGLSGLSFYLPKNKEDIYKYSTLDFYQHTQMSELLNYMFCNEKN